MRIAIIKDGTVENVVIGEMSFISSLYCDYLCMDVDARRCGPGMLYVDGEFVYPGNDSEQDDPT